MARFIAFLRAINVGGPRTIKMQVLREIFESLAFSQVETFIASGNVLFETTTRNTKALEKKIEKRLGDALGYPVATFLRTDAELAEIAAYKPFPKSGTDAAELNIIFLADPLDKKLERKVTALKTSTDEFRVRGREIYWLRRRKPGGYDFSSVPLGKTLGLPFTIRGYKTIQKLAMKLDASHHMTVT